MLPLSPGIERLAALDSRVFQGVGNPFGYPSITFAGWFDNLPAAGGDLRPGLYRTPLVFLHPRPSRQALDQRLHSMDNNYPAHRL